MCGCHVLIKSYLLTYLLTYLLINRLFYVLLLNMYLCCIQQILKPQFLRVANVNSWYRFHAFLS